MWTTALIISSYDFVSFSLIKYPLTTYVTSDLFLWNSLARVLLTVDIDHTKSFFRGIDQDAAQLTVDLCGDALSFIIVKISEVGRGMRGMRNRR